VTDVDAPGADAGATLLSVEHLVVEYPVGRHRRVHAVSDVSFTVRRGETLGVVGESGCGKSTTGRAIVQLPRPTSGSVVFDGVDLVTLAPDALRQVRPRLQMVFQDPVSSLNPRRRVEDIVGDPLSVWGPRDGGGASAGAAPRRHKVAEVLEAVGLDPATTAGRRPHEFSGGQCQRISIARALVLEPELLICDEPVSALDVSVQAQIINLLEEMKRRYRLTMLFISHDLAVVRNISDRVAVMYLGKLCEIGPSDDLYGAPAHPYTAALLAAIPEPDPDAGPSAGAGLSGELPSAVDPPSGCRFRTRCPRAAERCAAEEPPMRPVADGRVVACHFPLPVPSGPAAEPARPAVPERSA